jgi:hypothetical protein
MIKHLPVLSKRDIMAGDDMLVNMPQASSGGAVCFHPARSTIKPL